MKNRTKKFEQSFSARCYALLMQIPRGKVTTYKALAEALGTTAYRAVGVAMGKNPNAPKVPCHRVVRSDGTLGGYSGGLPRKIALLKSEGVKVQDGLVANFQKHFHQF